MVGETAQAPELQAAGPISALPLSQDLALYAGDDFYLDLTVTNPDSTNADLTGATPKSEIRVTAADTTAIATFIATVDAVNKNVIHLHLSHTSSAGLPAAAVWDCQITDAGGNITTLVAGKVTVTAEVTRP